MWSATKKDLTSLENDNTEVSLAKATKETDFLMEPAQPTFCKTVTLQIGCQKSEFLLENSSRLIRKVTVDETKRTVVPESL